MLKNERQRFMACVVVQHLWGRHQIGLHNESLVGVFLWRKKASELDEGRCVIRFGRGEL